MDKSLDGGPASHSSCLGDWRYGRQELPGATSNFSGCAEAEGAGCLASGTSSVEQSREEESLGGTRDQGDLDPEVLVSEDSGDEVLLAKPTAQSTPKKERGRKKRAVVNW